MIILKTFPITQSKALQKLIALVSSNLEGIRKNPPKLKKLQPSKVGQNLDFSFSKKSWGLYPDSPDQNVVTGRRYNVATV